MRVSFCLQTAKVVASARSQSGAAYFYNTQVTTYVSILRYPARCYYHANNNAGC